MYIKYCENKPKSDYIASEYEAQLKELHQKLNIRLTIQDLLIKPVQRIQKYQLVLKEIRKHMEKQKGMDFTEIDKAIQIMHLVPKIANDMMQVGRLTGFKGRITSQGTLLLQDDILIQEADTKNSKQSKLVKRHVFLFQQIIIFSEMVTATSRYSYPKLFHKNDIQVSSSITRLVFFHVIPLN